MSDFEQFSEDMELGMKFLEHHGILRQKWGKLNGPPYPLGSGDHSAAEIGAAKRAGIKVGQSSGKGSIENVKKSKPRSKSTPKPELTPEQKREAALEAVRTGDKKKITKYMDYLTTDELREAQARSQMKDALTRVDPADKKMTKAEVEKMEAIRSGDKEKVKQYADQMSYSELKEAMDKVDLNAKLNYVAPPKSAIDKLGDFMNNVEKFRSAAEKGVDMYNLAAKVYNSTHKDSKWPVIETAKEKKEDSDAKKVAKQITNDVAKRAKNNEADLTDKEKSAREEAKEDFNKQLLAYKNSKKLEKVIEKDEEKAAKKEAKEAKKAAEKEAKESEKAAEKEAKESEKDNKSLEEAREEFYQTLKNNSYSRMENVDTRPTDSELSSNEEAYLELLRRYN